MATSHNLPLDILRLLFEYSASTSVESAKTLSLVSKKIQLWTDPHLFQIIQGLGVNLSGKYRISLPDRMCMSDASPRICLARHYVRAIEWKENVPKLSYIEQALDSFPNLVQFCLGNNIFPHRPRHLDPSKHFVITRNYPSLRRVATSLYAQPHLPLNAFESPFWMNITHLQVTCFRAMSEPDSPFQHLLFVNMPSLTHLALLSAYYRDERVDVDLALSLVKQTFPSSLILCLLSLLTPEGISQGSWLVEMVNVSIKVDKRIVIWSVDSEDNPAEVVVTKDPSQEWRGVQDGVQTFWEKGEAILKRRKERSCVV
ncbi:hypothetical protein DL96DRAFT_1595828 [Flagelloscypha sp. PMI_526]|nr:hypothetical protein DL96DRAFT_1595828 [Flagelloscypha sp. PMI_526]